MYMKKDFVEYLLNPKTPGSKAHVWLGLDSACKMFSTGGMGKRRQKLFTTPMGKKICEMCATVVFNKERLKK